ncbi:MAG: glycosyltransferase family 4 protein [Acidobacteriota bacterium]
MRILFISNGYPPHRWAGTETYTAGIAEQLQRRGHEITVLCAGDWEDGSQYWNGYSDDVYHQVPVRRLNFNWTRSVDPNGYLYDNPVVAAYLTRYLQEMQPDLVHVTSCETLSASVLRVAHTAGIPLVLSLTDFWFLCPRITLLTSSRSNCDGVTTPWDCLRCQLLHQKAYRWARRFLSEDATSQLLMRVSRYPGLTRQRGLRGVGVDMSARKAFLRQALDLPNQVLTASTFVRDTFVKNGARTDIRLHHYGHDLSWLASYRGKTPSRLLRIGFIGQMVEEKGVHVLLEAVRLMQEDYREKFSVVVYGDLDKKPEYGNRLLQMATKTPNVEFRGIYPHDKSAEVFAEIDVLAVPSLWYDFPLIIHEAFASGTPVIASDLGSMAEVITHDVNGLLFEPDNSDDLTVQCRRIICEPTLLKRLCSGIPKVKTVDEEVDEIESLYADLLLPKECGTSRPLTDGEPQLGRDHA